MDDVALPFAIALFAALCGVAGGAGKFVWNVGSIIIFVIIVVNGVRYALGFDVVFNGVVLIISTLGNWLLSGITEDKDGKKKAKNPLTTLGVAVLCACVIFFFSYKGGIKVACDWMHFDSPHCPTPDVVIPPYRL